MICTLLKNLTVHFQWGWSGFINFLEITIVIRPILEYGDDDWDTQTHYLINKIENVQSEAARIVTLVQN
jgi:hypothetical protein